MINIEHFKFVLETKTEKSKKTAAGVFVEIRYHKEFDHTDSLRDDDTILEKIKSHVKEWFKEHPGLVIIYMDNKTEYDSPQKFTFSNRQKFIKEMLRQRVIVKNS